MNVAEAIAAAAIAEGVTTAFAVTDEATIHVAEALRDQGVRVVKARHEQNATVMADGYARASGRHGVCIAGAGPGLAQTASGLLTAARKRSPVLVMTWAPDERLMSAKAFDARRFAEACGASFVQVRGPATVAVDIREVFRRLGLGRGPVVMAVPDEASLYQEIQGALDYRPIARTTRMMPPVDHDSEAIEEAAALLLNAQRPLIVAGWGAVESDAQKDIVALADRTGALLGTSLQARELFRGHARNIGIVGTYGLQASMELVAECDAVLAVGISMNPYQTGGGPLVPGARMIQIDTDWELIGQSSPVDLAIRGDAAKVIRAVNACLIAANIEHSSAWTSDVGRERLANIHEKPSLPSSPPGDGLHVRTFMSALDAALPADRTIVLDGGRFIRAAMDYLSVPEPRAWMWTIDFAAVGLALSIAVGASIGRLDCRPVVVVGDGGFMMNVQELETAARELIDMTIIVINDGAYTAEARTLIAHGKSTELATFGDIDFAAVARSFGAHALTIRTLEDIDAIAEALVQPGPVLVDVKIAVPDL